MSDSTDTDYSFCKECKTRCKFDSDSDDSSSDTSSEYYQDSSDETSELPLDLTSLSISEEPETSSEYSDDSSEETSDLPIDLSSLTISEDDSEKESSEEGSEEGSEEVSDSADTSDVTLKRKRSTTSNNSDFMSELDFKKMSLDDDSSQDSSQDNVSQLSQLLSSMFVAPEKTDEDDLDILASKLSSKLRISPKKKRKNFSQPMDIEDVPIKERLRKSIKKPTKSGFKIVPREKWSSK